jgi:hypothetical protein
MKSSTISHVYNEEKFYLTDDRARYNVQNVRFLIWIDAASFKQISMQAIEGRKHLLSPLLFNYTFFSF